MEFTDDTEIAELLDLGTSVIQELQRAELKGPQTTGKPKVPPGNTRSLATLWEKESETRTEPEALPTEHANPDMSPASHNDPAKAAHEGAAEEGEADPEPDKAAGSDLTNSRPGDDLDKALAKLESRAKQNRTQQLIVKKGKGATKASHSTPPMSPQVAASTTVNKPGPMTEPTLDLGSQDIEESTLLPVEMEDWKSSAGATPYALQSEQNQDEKSASVGSVLSPASYVANPNDAMSALTRKVNDMESKIGEAIKLLGMLPVIKNEISQLKATVALMSNQLASIQILDPGNAGVKSLNEMKSLSKAASIVVTGPGSLPIEVLNTDTVYKDELARPVTAQAHKETKPKDEPGATSSDLTAVQALIDTLVEDDRRKSRLHQALQRARTKEDILRIKRQIYNA
uniref:Phosphoprotein n=1 Tax=avian paramyxovirus 2 TaxID=2560313 RepID=D9ZNM6_9MONO|nr:phosphoprotein [Avian metaavulavirus 2]